MLDRVGALLLLLLASRSARATPAHTSPPIPVTGWHATGWCAGMPDCASCAADMSCAWCASAGKCMGIDAANTGAAVCKRWDDATCSSTAKAAVEPPADVEEEGGLCHWCVTHGRGGCFSTTKPLQRQGDNEGHRKWCAHFDEHGACPAHFSPCFTPAPKRLWYDMGTAKGDDDGANEGTAHGQQGGALPLVLPIGARAAPNRPHWLGGRPDAFAVKPALPSGLHFNLSSGWITGSPHGPPDPLPIPYIIYASNPSGAVWTVLRLQITIPPTPPPTAVPTPPPVTKAGNCYVGPRFGYLAGCARKAGSGPGKGCSNFPTLREAQDHCDAMDDLCGGVTQEVTARPMVTDAASAAQSAQADTPHTAPQPYQLRRGSTGELHDAKMRTEVSWLKYEGCGHGSKWRKQQREEQVVRARQKAAASAAAVAAAKPAPLSYSAMVANYSVAVQITPNVARMHGKPVVVGASTGGVLVFAVQPALPDGLKLDPMSGVIQGTPTKPSPRRTYSVWASNARGVTHVDISIFVCCATAPKTKLPVLRLNTPAPTPRDDICRGCNALMPGPCRMKVAGTRVCVPYQQKIARRIRMWFAHSMGPGAGECPKGYQRCFPRPPMLLGYTTAQMTLTPKRLAPQNMPVLAKSRGGEPQHFMLTSIDPVAPRLAGHHLQHKLGATACGAHEDLLLWHGWMKGTLKEQWAEGRIRDRFQGIYERAHFRYNGAEVWRRVISASARLNVDNIAVHKEGLGGYLFLLAKPNRWALQPEPPAVEDEVGAALKAASTAPVAFGLGTNAAFATWTPRLNFHCVDRRQLWRSRWSVSPPGVDTAALPKGLRFNSSTGIISGTPAGGSSGPTRWYYVTARNAGGVSSTVLSMHVTTTGAPTPTPVVYNAKADRQICRGCIGINGPCMMHITGQIFCASLKRPKIDATNSSGVQSAKRCPSGYHPCVRSPAALHYRILVVSGAAAKMSIRPATTPSAKRTVVLLIALNGTRYPMPVVRAAPSYAGGRADCFCAFAVASETTGSKFGVCRSCKHAHRVQGARDIPLAFNMSMDPISGLISGSPVPLCTKTAATVCSAGGRSSTTWIAARNDGGTAVIKLHILVTAPAPTPHPTPAPPTPQPTPAPPTPSPTPAPLTLIELRKLAESCIGCIGGDFSRFMPCSRRIRGMRHVRACASFKHPARKACDKGYTRCVVAPKRLQYTARGFTATLPRALQVLSRPLIHHNRSVGWVLPGIEPNSGEVNVGLSVVGGDACTDNAHFVDQWGYACSAWVHAAPCTSAPKASSSTGALGEQEIANALRNVQNNCAKSCGTCVAYDVLNGIPMNLSPSFTRKGRGRVMVFSLSGTGQSDLLAHNLTFDSRTGSISGTPYGGMSPRDTTTLWLNVTMQFGQIASVPMTKAAVAERKVLAAASRQSARVGLRIMRWQPPVPSTQSPTASPTPAPPTPPPTPSPVPAPTPMPIPGPHRCDFHSMNMSALTVPTGWALTCARSSKMRLDGSLVAAGFLNAAQAAPCPAFRMLGDAQYHCQLDEACAGVVKVPQGDFPYQLRAFVNHSRASREARGTQYWHCVIMSNWRTGCLDCVGLFGPCQRHYGTVDACTALDPATQQCPKGYNRCQARPVELSYAQSPLLLGEKAQQCMTGATAPSMCTAHLEHTAFPPGVVAPNAPFRALRAFFGESFWLGNPLWSGGGRASFRIRHEDSSEQQLPPGLTLDDKTGVISGRVLEQDDAAAFIRTVTVEASNSGGSSTTIVAISVSRQTRAPTATPTPAPIPVPTPVPTPLHREPGMCQGCVGIGGVCMRRHWNLRVCTAASGGYKADLKLAAQEARARVRAQWASWRVLWQRQRRAKIPRMPPPARTGTTWRACTHGAKRCWPPIGLRLVQLKHTGDVTATNGSHHACPMSKAPAKSVSMFQSIGEAAIATLTVNEPIDPLVPELSWSTGSGLPTHFTCEFVHGSTNVSHEVHGVGLLPGLCFDRESGVISGTPTLLTENTGVQYKVSAKNTAGKSSVLLSIVVASMNVATTAAPSKSAVGNFRGDGIVPPLPRAHWNVSADERAVIRAGYRGPRGCVRCMERALPCFSLSADGRKLHCDAEISHGKCRHNAWRCPPLSRAQASAAAFYGDYGIARISALNEPETTTAAASDTAPPVPKRVARLIDLATACAKCVQQGASCRSARPSKTGDYFCYPAVSLNSASASCPPRTVPCDKSRVALSGGKVVLPTPAPRKCPVLTLLGPELIVLSAGFPYIDAGATARSADNKRDLSDAIVSEGNTVTIASAFESQRSCKHIQKLMRAQSNNTAFAPEDDDAATRPTASSSPPSNATQPVQLPSGWYYITRMVPTTGSGAPTVRRKLRVWCDMVSDGGGYTLYPIQHGIATARISDANSCQKLGLQMVVPRTDEHLRSMVARFGMRYFNAVPGIFGVASGSAASRHTRGRPMNSGVSSVSEVWKALDGGHWFLSGVGVHGEPSNKYQEGCWLGIRGWSNKASTAGVHYEAVGCNARTSKYLCSTNDKDPLTEAERHQAQAALQARVKASIKKKGSQDALRFEHVCPYLEFVGKAIGTDTREDASSQLQLLSTFALLHKKRKDGRPVYSSIDASGISLGLGSKGKTFYLFYSERHQNWVVADALGRGAVVMLVSSTALVPAHIAGTWLLVGDPSSAAQFKPLPTLRVQCQKELQLSSHDAAGAEKGLSAHSTAVKGRYVITYHVEDDGVAECQPVMRTVVVR